MISYISFELLLHNGGEKKVASTKDEQVMAIFIKRSIQKMEKNDIHVFTASSRWLVL